MIVVDTTILLYAALGGARSEMCDPLFRWDARWAAPLLWRSEFRNVVAGYLRRHELDHSQALEAVSIAAGFLTAGEHLVRDNEVIDLVERSPCTAYNCEFVVLAQRLDVLLITEDKALLRNFPQRCRSIQQIAGIS